MQFLDKRLLADAGLDGLIDGSPFPPGFAGAFGTVGKAWSDPEPVESAPNDSHMMDNEIRAVCRRPIAAGNGGTARNPVCQP
ncbi:MAG: hypothetical protein BroJett030_22770 [Alphaproteobacteria bacterium]|nr:MAG: hypothetical protein BroJett030_22770 [Alphaproteobacteria bacterium]